MKTVSDAKCRLFVAGIIGIVSLALSLGGCTSAQAPTQSPAIVATSDSLTPSPANSAPLDLSVPYITALESNLNLQPDEKAFIIDNFKSVFQQNAQYIIDSELLITTLNNIRIQYSKNYKHADSGTYDSSKNIIYIYNGDTFTESVNAPDQYLPGTLAHEFFHVLGGLVVPEEQGKNNSIYEGLNDLLTREYDGEHSGNPYYDDCVLMAKIMIELFGDIAISKAFWGLGTGSLLEDIQSKYGIDINDALTMINTLAGHIQSRNRPALLDDINTMPFIGGLESNVLLQVYLYQLTGKSPPEMLDLKAGERIKSVTLTYFNSDMPDYGGPATVTITDKNGKNVRTVIVARYVRGT